MQWYFTPLPAGQVETEVTQRDQFSNDEVDISETIVREAVQNSLDALADGEQQVRVSFRWVDAQSGLDTAYCRALHDGQLDHAKAAELPIEGIDFDNARALVIEDFGTKGLTGATDGKDNGNFTDFWRRHGKSHKTGRSRGRWGLGKLVYSTSSQTGVFFGLTRRKNDPQSFLMGQTVLNLRRIGDLSYPPHGFFCELENADEPLQAFPVPESSESAIHDFSSKFCLRRTDEPGLSVVIPYPNPAFEETRMIQVAISNYFYPIITGQLILEIGETAITSANIHQLAEEHLDEDSHQTNLLFNFIEEAHSLDAGELAPVLDSWPDDKKLDEDDFDEETLERIRKTFSDGSVVGLRLPVTITRKDGTKESSFFSAFMQKPDGIQKGRDLYVRGGLTVPGEAKFRERRAFGAMIAHDEAICSLLGDAENAAHTKWVASAEKVKKNYRTSVGPLVTMIRNSLVDLYDLLAEVTEEVDEDALREFLSTPEPEASPKSRKKRKKTPKVVPPIPEPRPRLFDVHKKSNGFAVTLASPEIQDKLPVTLRVTAAYDVVRGNAFKRYSVHDFRFIGKGSSIKWTLKKDTAEIREKLDNELVIDVVSADFRIEADGFDPNRDLRVKVTAERS